MFTLEQHITAIVETVKLELLDLGEYLPEIKDKYKVEPTGEKGCKVKGTYTCDYKWKLNYVDDSGIAESHYKEPKRDKFLINIPDYTDTKETRNLIIIEYEVMSREYAENTKHKNP